MHELAVYETPEQAIRNALITPEVAACQIGELFGCVGKWSFKASFKGAAKFGRKVKRSAKAVIKSPVVKVGVAGLAIAFPPAGVPAAAALATANAVVTHLESADKAKRKLAQKLCTQTAAAAKAGDSDARRAIGVLVIAKRMRRAQRVARRDQIRALRAKEDAKRAAAAAAVRRPRVRAAPRIVQAPVPRPKLPPAAGPRRRLVTRAIRRRRPGRVATPGKIYRGVVVTHSRKCLRGRWTKDPHSPTAGILITRSGRCYRGSWIRV